MADEGTLGAVTLVADGGVKRLIIAWTSSAAGRFEHTFEAIEIDGLLLALVTDPGATAPTDNYDVTITDVATGIDILNNLGANRDTADTERVPITIGSLGQPHPARCRAVTGEGFTLKCESTGNAKVGTVILYWT